MMPDFSSKRILDFDISQYEEDRPCKRQNYAQNEDDEPSLKRLPDFIRSDRNAKYRKRRTDFSKPIRKINNRDYSTDSAFSQKILEAVSGAQLLNACKNEQKQEAFEALNKIQSFAALKSNNKDERFTAFYYALTTEMVDVTDAICIKVRHYFYNAIVEDDRDTIADIKSQFNLIYLLVEDRSETMETREKINNVILGSQLIEACKKGNEYEASELLSKITSYDGLQVLDEKGKNAYKYSSGNIELAFLKKVREFEYNARENKDFATLRAIEESFDFETLYRYK